MPVEIREIIIKTEVSVNENNRAYAIKEKELNALRNQLQEEFKKIVSEQHKRKTYTR